MKEIIKYGVTLGTICLFASGTLALVNGVTEPQIKIQKEKAEKEALREVMPESARFEPQFEADKVLYYRAYGDDDKLNGFVIKAEDKGYSSSIEAMAGLNLSLEITNIKILSQNETPGLGSKITGPVFLGRFKGKRSDALAGVDSITGATISSRAVIKSIKDKIEALEPVLRKDIEAL